MTAIHRFPFSAVVGHNDLKLALILHAIDPAIGGVLLRGDKGTAKSTLARSVATLLPGDAPFVELPVGATEDRVTGSLDLGAALHASEERFRPGLLAAADGGVLYVDEVNLLPDHLVDVLLDAAASGINRVERDGISHEHPSRFVLAGSMNPEEGDLRPQLLDRFGLAVTVRTPTDPDLRAEAVVRRLAFDADPEGFCAQFADHEKELRARLADTPNAVLPPEVVRAVSKVCASLGAEGLRADLVICRAAVALARWEQRMEATLEDAQRVAPLALAHRARRDPLAEGGLEPEMIDRTFDEATSLELSSADQEPEPGDFSDDTNGRSDDHGATPDAPAAVVGLGTSRARRLAVDTTGRRARAEGPRGRLVDDRTPDGPITDAGTLAVAATLRVAAHRRAADPALVPALAGGPLVQRSDLREAVREHRIGRLLVLTVDASGSMGAPARMEAVKGAVLGLLLDAYQRRDRVALVTFRDDGAHIVLRPTGSVEVARTRLETLPTGGRTPLAAGLDAAATLAAQAKSRDMWPLLVVITDGRATAAPDGYDPVAAAHVRAAAIRHAGVESVVVDAETGTTRLGLAEVLASALGGRHLTLPELTAHALEHTLRTEVLP
jgi:magnesium chelatase subunit D